MLKSAANIIAGEKQFTHFFGVFCSKLKGVLHAFDRLLSPSLMVAGSDIARPPPT